MADTKSFKLVRIARDIVGKRASKLDGEDTESGFTLIELMVVLLIMAILLAIAIPTFLGVKGGAQDRAAESNLTNAAISAKAYYVNNSSYDTATVSGATGMVADLSAAEPELTFTYGVSAAPNTISVANTASILVMTMVSKNGASATAPNCFWAIDNETSGAVSVDGASANPGISYGLSTASTCQASTSSAVTNALTAVGWGSSYPVGLPN